MLTLALPKGRIAEEAVPLLQKIDLTPEDAFFQHESRQLKFSTANRDLEIIRVRAFDAATYLAYGVAQLGIIGSDVLDEHDFDGIYAPLDLNIGKCRLSIAGQDISALTRASGTVRIATKYPNLTRKFFVKHGIQAECVKLSGALELAPRLGLCDLIVDLVSSGATLKANGLQELEKITDVSARLTVNRVAYKTSRATVESYIQRFAAFFDDRQSSHH